MKVRIYEESMPVPEKEIILRMFKQLDSGHGRGNEIVIAVVDENGDQVLSGQLIAFGSNMKLIRRELVSEKLGLPTNAKGRLLLEEESFWKS